MYINNQIPLFSSFTNTMYDQAHRANKLACMLNSEQNWGNFTRTPTELPGAICRAEKTLIHRILQYWRALLFEWWRIFRLKNGTNLLVRFHLPVDFIGWLCGLFGFQR